MISQETACNIYSAHREIEAGKKLIEDMLKAREELEKNRGSEDATKLLRDAFGRRQQLELGVPSGNNSHRIFGVAPELAGSVIRAHIAKKRAELVAHCEIARHELDAEVGASEADDGDN